MKGDHHGWLLTGRIMTLWRDGKSPDETVREVTAHGWRVITKRH